MLSHTILVASYKEPQTTQISACLQKAGYQVSVVGYGHSALRAIRRQQPDLVILEWQLPDLSSLALIRMIRSDPEITRLPIILRATEIKEQEFLLAMGAGADACLKEPFQPAIFIARVRAVMRRCHAYESAA